MLGAPFYLSDRVNFDIETTSYERDGEKRAIVYSWAICINGGVTVFRYREEFLTFLRAYAKKRKAHIMNRLVVYVHNLGYEYEFIRNYFDIVPTTERGRIGEERIVKETFFIGNVHRPARILTKEGIEFRCSYLLTNAPLARVGDQVGIPKMLGDLDYDLIRHPETPLTDEELGYIRNDVLIVDRLIESALAKENGKYESIPMTLTGYTRRKVRKRVFADKKYTRWLGNTPISPEVYSIASRCFRGGYTHASARTAGQTLTNVYGWDIASSYPASIVQFKFPMSAFVKVNPDDIGENRAMVLLEMSGVECNYDFALISESACETLSGGLIDNGRVFTADSLSIWLTDVDLELTLRNYSASDAKITAAYAAKSDYLPTSFVTAILEMYALKTELKGVPGREEDYADAKVDVNSVYGMTAEDPVHDDFIFDTESNMAVEVPTTVGLALDEHNDARSRFLYYPWAAFVTAGSRYVLQSALMDVEDAGLRAHYCDTDSIYLTGDEAKIHELFENVNEQVMARMVLAMRHHGLADDAFAPKTIKGEVKPLGLFEEDAQVIDEFKSLGAKRYAKVIDGKLSLTVSGLSKGAAKWLSENGGLAAFEDGMVVPPSDSGRVVHTYLTEPIDEEITDYLGNTAHVTQHGGVHLEGSSYSLGMSELYQTFLQSQVW